MYFPKKSYNNIVQTRTFEMAATLTQVPNLGVKVIKASRVNKLCLTYCFKKSFTTLEAYINLLRGYIVV
jgi:hypothetical protein